MRNTRLWWGLRGVSTALFILLICTSCQTPAGTTMEYLEHTMLETEFSQIDGKDYLEYRFENAFFNSDDLFDMYEINDGELSHWDAYYDDTYQTFLSQPVYGDGFVRWNAHPDSPSVVADRTVRFYRISSR